MSKLFSEACERNKLPILEHIKNIYKDNATVLEIGSGTGQHAAYFAENLPDVTWQTSDRKQNHASILAWVQDSTAINIVEPIELDVAIQEQWPSRLFEGIFTANTCHIMSWEEVVDLFSLIGTVIKAGGNLCIYGPFKYNGEFTSESNAGFDTHLKRSLSHMGIRDFESINELAEQHKLELVADYQMPANNQLLHFTRKV